MTRINRPDTLLTELRDIKRRLHALETAQRTTTATTAEAATAQCAAAETTTARTTFAEPEPTETADPEAE